MSRKTRRNASKKIAKQLSATATRPTCSAVGISGLAMGAIALTRPLFAADADAGPTAPAADNNNDNTLQEVVVTGIRASLQKSLDVKQQAVGVEDAISAEDIGQFPDASIGEAIARIPGVTVNRGSINSMGSAGAPTSTGQVTGVTVRGFGDQFNELLSNGRPIASGNGQNFDFSALGAEYVGEVDVHKTPDFALSTGAIGASIDIKSPNPFDNPGMQARAFASGNDYQKDGGVTPAFGGLFSDTFADDTVGFLVAGDYTTKHIDGDHFDIVGWKGVPSPSDPNNPAKTLPGYMPCTAFAAAPAGSGCPGGAGGDGFSAAPSWYPQDQAMYLERTDSRRMDGRLAVQWHPADNVLVTLDDNYSSDDEKTQRWQYSTWFGCFPAGCSNVTQDGNGTITNFTYAGGPTDLNAVQDETYIVTNTPGVNVKWDVNDQWSAAFDASQSMAKFNPNHTWNHIDADVGYGPNTALGTNGYTGGDVVTGSGNSLPYWGAVGPNTVATGNGTTTSPNYLGLNPFIIGSHVLPIQEQVNTDKVNQIKLDGTWHKDALLVHFGAQFVEDTWDSNEYDTLTNNEWQLWSGYGPASNNVVYYCGAIGTKCASQTNPGAGAIPVVHGVALPPALFTPVSVSNFIPGYKNNGNLPQSLLLFNPYSVLNYLETQPINADYAPGMGGNYTGGSPTAVLNPSLSQHVQRKNYAPFLTGQETFPIGDMSLKANVALRYERTDATIAGLNAPLLGLIPNAGDKTAYTFNLGPSLYTLNHISYGYVLPSLDLNLLVRPDLKVRLDASRTETQPNNNQIIPSTSYTGRVSALSSTTNNPGLLPYLSDNFDLGAEWYYAQNDYLSVDGFFKHVTQFPVASVSTVTVPGVNDTTGPNIGNPAQFAQIEYVNGLAANVTGVELTWQQMLGYGFGFQVNGTYVHSNANFNPYSTVTNQFALPGIGNSANLITFYESHGFHARLAVQFQAKQLLQLGQEQNGGAFGNEPTYLEANTEVDFSSSYDIGTHMSVFFEALNLSDNVYHTVGRFDNQTLNVIDYGRSFTFGVRAKL
jgi:iron complex outermembrane receptor protein